MRKIMQVTTELERNRDLMMVDVVGIVSYFIDKNYGADADGNRGQSTTIVDEVVEISVWDLEGKFIEVTPKEEDYLADRLTIKFLEE